MNRFFLLFAFAWAALIFAASSQPGSSVGLPPPWDKLAHLTAYAVLAGLLRAGGLNPAAAFLIAALYGVSDEWHQSFVAGRDANPGDWLADALGAALASWFPYRRS